MRLPPAQPDASTAGAIRWERVRRVVRLLGEMREIGPGENARRHLVQALVLELGARVGVMVLDAEFRRGGKGGLEGATLVGLDASTMPIFAMSASQGCDSIPVLEALMIRSEGASPDEVLTHRREDVVSSRDWERSHFFNELVRPAGFDQFIVSVQMIAPHRAESFGFMRQRGESPFSDEDRDVLRLVQLELPRLFGLAPIPLAPRVRQTLDHLLAGASDKEIAARLGISPHTVREYVKTLLRVHRVNSRGQLAALFRRDQTPH